MRGRKPKPTKLKILDGNPGHRPLNESEPQPAISEAIIECPEWLVADARVEWYRILPELRRLGLMTVVDSAALEAHCANYGRAIEAERMLARDGFVVDTEHGLKKHPAATVARESWTLVRAFLSEFGMSPASRSRVHAKEEQSQDSLAAFLNQA